MADNSRFENNKRLISAQQLSEIISLINIYLIRRGICALEINNITRLFPTLLKNVLENCNGNYAKIVDYVKINLINKQRGKTSMMPDDEMLRNYLEYANVYNSHITLKVIFEKIEMHNNLTLINFEKLSVEHLMPQMPTKE